MCKIWENFILDHKLLGFNLDIVKDMERISSIRYDYKRMDIKGHKRNLKSSSSSSSTN